MADNENSNMNRTDVNAIVSAQVHIAKQEICADLNQRCECLKQELRKEWAAYSKEIQNLREASKLEVMKLVRDSVHNANTALHEALVELRADLAATNKNVDGMREREKLKDLLAGQKQKALDL